MDRQEWGEMLGDDTTIEADLRWTLFQAERCVQTMRQEALDEKHIDTQVSQINLRRIYWCKIALAAFWSDPSHKEPAS